MTDEQAKAIQEVAKATGKSIDVIGSTGAFLNQVLGNPLREFGGIIWDQAKYWRYRNQIAIFDKVQAIQEKRDSGGKTVPIPPAFAMQVLDAVSIESEDEIQILWAGLIANATDPSLRLRIRKVFIDVLRGLEPLDARIMEFLSTSGLDERYGFQTGAKLNAEELASRIGADLQEVKISVQTLARFGCVIDSWEHTPESLDSGYSGFRVNNPSSNFRLSHLGKELVSATATTNCPRML